MSDIAIRVENCILSRVEGLSKLYPAVAPRARHLGRAQQRHDTPSTRLRTRLRDAIVGTFKRANVGTLERSEDLWALKDVSFEACPEPGRRVKQGEVVGTLAPAVTSAGVIGRNGAGKSTLPSTSDRRSALRARLKILSRITEPTTGRAETCGGRVASLPDASRGTGSQSDPELTGRENIRFA